MNRQKILRSIKAAMPLAKLQQQKTCYMCDRPATSREHAPPKCFFPKEADQPIEFRKNLTRNLISVPSCDEHNSKKSSNDEYLRFVICSTFNGNSYKQSHWEDKVLRSLKAQQGKFKKFAPELIPVVLEGPDGTREESAAIQVNQAAFDQAVEHIGRAVHFHHFGEKAPRLSVVHTAEFLDITSQNREKVNQIHKDLQETVDKGFDNESIYGENPEIFFYQVIMDKDHNAIFSMTFYEGMKVTVAFSSNELKSSRSKGAVIRRNPLMSAGVRSALDDIQKK